MLKPGEKAPDFTLPDQNGQPVSLSSFLGKTVILYFYPRDNTPGCTKEACSFRDHYPLYTEKDAVIIGISPNTSESHQKFAEKYELPFLLLADPEKEVIQAYGCLLYTSLLSYKRPSDHSGLRRIDFFSFNQYNKT